MINRLRVLLYPVIFGLHSSWWRAERVLLRIQPSFQAAHRCACAHDRHGDRRSTEWGVMPWHWYLTSALPRGLLAAMPLAMLGAWLERRVRSCVAVAAAVVVSFSCLGHKEVCVRCVSMLAPGGTHGCAYFLFSTASYQLSTVQCHCCEPGAHLTTTRMQGMTVAFKHDIRVQLRFVLPILPLLNVAAACALARLLANARKGTRHGVAALAALALLAGSIGAALLLTLAAYHNYPGAFQHTMLLRIVSAPHIATVSARTPVARKSHV